MVSFVLIHLRVQAEARPPRPFIGTSRPEVAALLFVEGGSITGVKWTCGEPAASLLRPPTSDFYGAPEVLLRWPAWE